MFANMIAVSVLIVTAVAQTTTLTGGLTSTTTTGSAGTAVQPAGATTISAYIGSAVKSASVVTANACSTVLAVSCEDEEVGEMICANAMSAGVGTVTVTAHPYGLEIAETVTTLGAVVTLSLKCSYLGASPTYTAEACSASLGFSADGQSSSTTAVTTTTTMITPYPVVITAGAQNLPTGSQSCTSTPNAAMPTAVVQVYKVLVPVGAAVAAGAVLF